MFILIFILLQSVSIWACEFGLFQRLDKALLSQFATRYIIDGWRGVHEFLQGTKDLSGKSLSSKTLYKSIHFQNGAIVDLTKGTFLVLDIFNLSCTSKSMKLFFEDKEYKPLSDDYWLKQRCLVDMYKEILFQRAFLPVFRKSIIRHVSYLQVVKAHDTKCFGNIHERIGLGGFTIGAEELFDAAGSLFIGIASEGLLDIYSKPDMNSRTLNEKHTEISRFLFQMRGIDVLPNDEIRNVILLIAAGLSFFIPSSTAELEAIKERFLNLKTLFCDLTEDCVLWADKNNSLKSINYPSTIEDFDFDKKTAFLWTAAKIIFYDLLNFQNHWILYEKELFNNFSDEKKLLFFYCNSVINSTEYEVKSVCLKRIKFFILDFYDRSMQYIFKQKYDRIAVDFFSHVRKNTNMGYTKKIGSLLAPLLNAHDVTTFFSFFNNVLEADKRIRQLQGDYHTLSCNDIAIHFHLLLEADWEKQFKKIADCNFQKFEDIRKINEEKAAELKNKINGLENDLEEAKKSCDETNQKHLNVKKSLALILSNQAQEVQVKHNKAVMELQSKHDQAIKSNNNEQSSKMDLFKKKILKIFVVTQLCLLFVYSVFFKYISYAGSCIK